MIPNHSETMLNCIDQVNHLKTALTDELLFYSDRKGANPLYMDIKAKQIKCLQDLADTFANVYNDIENALFNVNITQNEHDNKVFKLEAALIYYGVSITEINYITKMQPSQVASTLKQCIAEKWRQVPLMFKPLLDETKTAKNWENYNVTVHKNGVSEYSTPLTPEPKTATEPVYNWSNYFKK